MKIHRILTHVCLHVIGCLYYCCYAKTSSPAVQKRHSKVYGNPIAPSFYLISPWSWAENIKIVDIEINAFNNLKINLILRLHKIQPIRGSYAESLITNQKPENLKRGKKRELSISQKCPQWIFRLNDQYYWYSILKYRGAMLWDPFIKRLR